MTKKLLSKKGFSRITYLIFGSFFSGMLAMLLVQSFIDNEFDTKIRFILLIISALLALWSAVIYDQKQKRIPVACGLIKEKVESLKRTPFNELAGLIGKGYIFENHVVGGVTYYMGYAVHKAGQRHLKQNRKGSTEPASEITVPDAIEISGYVDCISILPFVYFKIGPAFRMNLLKTV